MTWEDRIVRVIGLTLLALAGWIGAAHAQPTATPTPRNLPLMGGIAGDPNQPGGHQEMPFNGLRDLPVPCDPGFCIQGQLKNATSRAISNDCGPCGAFATRTPIPTATPVATVTPGEYVRKAGDTMTGKLIIGAGSEDITRLDMTQHATQSVDLFQLKYNSGNVMFTIDKDGNVTLQNDASTGNDSPKFTLKDDDTGIFPFFASDANNWLEFGDGTIAFLKMVWNPSGATGNPQMFAVDDSFNFSSNTSGTAANLAVSGDFVRLSGSAPEFRMHNDIITTANPNSTFKIIDCDNTNNGNCTIEFEIVIDGVLVDFLEYNKTTGLILGDTLNPALTVQTDGTGDSEVVLPTDSIGADEIGDDAIDNVAKATAAIRTGLDAKFVTGTAGSTNDCAKWDASGDLITSGASCGGAPSFADITGGTNTGAAMIVSTGAAITPSGSGAIQATLLTANAVDAITEIAPGLKSGADATLVTGTAGGTGLCAEWDANGDLIEAASAAACGSGGGAPSFDEITSGTNSTAAMVVTTGASIVRTGSGAIQATLLVDGTVDAITEIASGLKTGNDLELVTGTAGSSGNCAEWNANGDLVEAASVAACGAQTTFSHYLTADNDIDSTTWEILFDFGSEVVVNSTYSFTCWIAAETSSTGATDPRVRINTDTTPAMLACSYDDTGTGEDQAYVEGDSTELSLNADNSENAVLKCGGGFATTSSITDGFEFQMRVSQNDAADGFDVQIGSSCIINKNE